MLHISRQSHHQYLQREQQAVQKAALYLNLIHEVRQRHPSMGLRTIYEKAMPEGIGRDAFISLGAQHDYILQAQVSKTKTTIAHPAALYPNLLANKKFTDVNQIWSSDITYYAIGDKWYYLTFIMDVYSRRIVGYTAADNMRASNNVAALNMALDLRDVPDYAGQLIHHSDRGGQYISEVYVKLLQSKHIHISMCQNVLENSHVERVNGIIKNKYLKYWRIESLRQLKSKLKKAVDAYNYDKPHQSLKGKSPVDFENFIKELPPKERPNLEIFTYHQNSEQKDPNQLVLEF